MCECCITEVYTFIDFLPLLGFMFLVGCAAVGFAWWIDFVDGLGKQNDNDERNV